MHYGKPYDPTYSFVESEIKQKWPDVKRVYMIGDNLQTDILGANQRNKMSQDVEWISVAVTETGIYDEHFNDTEEIRPCHKVGTFEDAISLIFHLEQIN